MRKDASPFSGLSIVWATQMRVPLSMHCGIRFPLQKFERCDTFDLRAQDATFLVTNH
jgi:hypothetical protein